MNTLKLLICGGKSYNNQDRVNRVLDKIKSDWEKRGVKVVLIHGGASGADSRADDWARTRGVEREVFHAKWKTYGKPAGMIRNKQMLNEKPDMVIAFPGGKGTDNMISISEKAGVPVIKIED